MNPPTIGHKKLVEAMDSYDGDKIIHLSHSQGTKKNPLSYSSKLEYCQKAFGSCIQESVNRNIVDSLKELSKSYKNIVLVVGSDRIDEFVEMFEEYSDSEFPFENWKIVSAGDRTLVENDSSATKLRDAFIKEDIDNIRELLPEELHEDIDEIYEEILTSYGIKNAHKYLQQEQRKLQIQNYKRVLKSCKNK